MLVSHGVQDYVIAGVKFSPLASFLLDKDTNTYSLSKFQLLALSLVSFFAYVYVFLCQALVQWRFVLPEARQCRCRSRPKPRGVVSVLDEAFLRLIASLQHVHYEYFERTLQFPT